MIFNILNNIPISINAQLGDPFQQSQWESNTKKKLEYLELKKYKGPVALITKFCLTKEQIDYIANSNLDIFVFLSITGLNENKKASFEDISNNYLELCKTNKNIAIFIRPIIPNYNDNIDVILPIIKLASQGQKKVIIRGYKDIYNINQNAYLSEDLFQKLSELCHKYNVAIYEKTMYLVSEIRKDHFINTIHVEPEVIYFLQKIGYNIEYKNKKLILADNYKYSPGDINFIHMITGIRVENSVEGKVAKLTIHPKGLNLDCSSSWFGWARRVDCEINCWYCIDRIATKNGKTELEFGCCPTDLIN